VTNAARHPSTRRSTSSRATPVRASPSRWSSAAACCTVQAATVTAVAGLLLAGYLVTNSDRPARSPAVSAAAPDSPVVPTHPATSTSPATTAPTNPATTAPVPGCPPLESFATAAPVAGCSYLLEHLPVTDVPADEGFWVTYVDGAPMWVHLDGSGESPEAIQPGQTVTVTATITALGDTPDTGASPSQAERLATRGVYLAVQYADLTVDPAS